VCWGVNMCSVFRSAIHNLFCFPTNSENYPPWTSSKSLQREEEKRGEGRAICHHTGKHTERGVDKSRLRLKNAEIEYAGKVERGPQTKRLVFLIPEGEFVSLGIP